MGNDARDFWALSERYEREGKPIPKDPIPGKYDGILAYKAYLEGKTAADGAGPGIATPPDSGSESAHLLTTLFYPKNPKNPKKIAGHVPDLSRVLSIKARAPLNSQAIWRWRGRGITCLGT